MAKTNQKSSSKMEQVMALWKHQAKSGLQYLGNKGFIGYYNTKKKNPKEPDLRIYKVDKDGNFEKETYLSLWCKVAKDGVTKYLTGQLDGRWVIGFINKDTKENKRPYLSIYYQDEVEVKEPKKEDTPALTFESDDLPF